MKSEDLRIKITKLNKTIRYARKDELTQFVLQKDRDELNELRQQFFNTILSHAKQLGIGYIYISEHEISGCEGIRHNGWPAIWEVAARSGFPSSCGNSDQYQFTELRQFVPEGTLGAWDTNQRTKLQPSEIRGLKFRLVVSK